MPNLRDGGQTNEKASPERLACCVDYYVKLSNLLDAIRALNVASRELSGSFFVAGRDR